LCTHYDVLKVTRDAPAEVIRAAYRSLSSKYHPDRTGLAESGEVMSAINTAYAVLSNPLTRRGHDFWIAEQESMSAGGTDPRRRTRTRLVLSSPAIQAHGNASRRRYSATVIIALLLSALTYALAPVLAPTDMWLDRAWQQIRSKNTLAEPLGRGSGAPADSMRRFDFSAELTPRSDAERSLPAEDFAQRH
jgi:curved DNA-binding protein CbpA